MSRHGPVENTNGKEDRMDRRTTRPKPAAATAGDRKWTDGEVDMLNAQVRASDPELGATVRFITTWPEEADDGHRRRPGRWQATARLLARRPGLPAIVATGLDSVSARAMASRLRRGDAAGFTPPGSHRAGVIPDPDHKGRWAVVAMRLPITDRSGK